MNYISTLSEYPPTVSAELYPKNTTDYNMSAGPFGKLLANSKELNYDVSLYPFWSIYFFEQQPENLNSRKRPEDAPKTKRTGGLYVRNPH
jgi:hypothetical protein